MSVLVYAEAHGGAFNKKSQEVVTYARKTADKLGTDCIAVTVNADVPGSLGTYGAQKVIQLQSEHLDQFDAGTFADALTMAAEKVGADTLVLQHSAEGKAVLGRVAVKWAAGSVSGVNALPEVNETFKVQKPLFSGKAFGTYEIQTDKRVLSLAGNSIAPEEMGSEVEAETMELSLEAPKIKVVKVDKVEGEIPLTEADRVVSAGRGM